jgi:hypothetical protein
MGPRVRLGDRREYVRFEVAGHLWVALGVGQQVVIRNVCSGGALLEARLPAALRSIRSAQIALRESGPEVNVSVRHVSPMTTAPDEERFLIGVEFVNLSPEARADVDHLVQAGQPLPPQ